LISFRVIKGLLTADKYIPNAVPKFNYIISKSAF